MFCKITILFLDSYQKRIRVLLSPQFTQKFIIFKFYLSYSTRWDTAIYYFNLHLFSKNNFEDPFTYIFSIYLSSFARYLLSFYHCSLVSFLPVFEFWELLTWDSKSWAFWSERNGLPRWKNSVLKSFLLESKLFLLRMCLFHDG